MLCSRPTACSPLSLSCRTGGPFSPCTCRQLKAEDDDVSRQRTTVHAVVSQRLAEQAMMAVPEFTPRRFERLVALVARLYRGRPALAARFWQAHARRVRAARGRW